MIVDENGMCTLNEEDYSYHSNGREKRKTNADRIRAMSDTELALWLAAMLGVNPFDGTGNDYNKWLEWLKQEAET